MNTITHPTPAFPLVAARHVVGMGVVSLGNPLIYHASSPLMEWAVTLFGALAAAALIYGLYALFLTQRAKENWPRGIIITAWVIVAASALVPWVDKAQAPRVEPSPTAAPIEQAPAAKATPVRLVPFNGKLDGEN